MSPRSAALAHPTSQEALHQLEKVVIEGNLATLTPAERIGYYARVCESVGINPLTRPFEYLTLNGRLILYARKDATDQLRKINGISIDRLDRDVAADMATVTAYGHDRTGRTDSSIGAVPIRALAGEQLANALMKAETKAKRRLTLSLAGLGWLDETEVATVEETPGETIVVSTRAEAVAARAAALPTIEQAEGQEPAANRSGPPPSSQDTELDVDQVPFESGPVSGDLWLRRLHAVGAERGLDHTALHELAVGRFGVDSLTALSVVQRGQLLAHVEAIEPPSDSDTHLSDPAATEQVVEPGARAKTAEGGDAGVTSSVSPIDSPVATPEQAWSETSPAMTVSPPAAAIESSVEPDLASSEVPENTGPSAPPAAPSVGTPLSIQAFSIYAAAALGITDIVGWELAELNTPELEHVVSAMAVEDYDAWFKAASRELRAVLRNGQMSPRQRRDRTFADEARERLFKAAVGAP